MLFAAGAGACYAGLHRPRRSSRPRRDPPERGAGRVLLDRRGAAAAGRGVLGLVALGRRAGGRPVARTGDHDGRLPAVRARPARAAARSHRDAQPLRAGRRHDPRRADPGRVPRDGWVDRLPAGHRCPSVARSRREPAYRPASRRRWPRDVPQRLRLSRRAAQRRQVHAHQRARRPQGGHHLRSSPDHAAGASRHRQPPRRPADHGRHSRPAPSAHPAGRAAERPGARDVDQRRRRRPVHPCRPVRRPRGQVHRDGAVAPAAQADRGDRDEDRHRQSRRPRGAAARGRPARRGDRVRVVGGHPGLRPDG